MSRFGDGLYVAALSWSAFSFTHSAESVALVGFASAGPTFVATPRAGGFRDIDEGERSAWWEEGLGARGELHRDVMETRSDMRGPSSVPP